MLATVSILALIALAGDPPSLVPTPPVVVPDVSEAVARILRQEAVGQDAGSGACWAEDAELTGAEAGHRDWQGWSVALSGDTAIVSAHKPFGGGPGDAYVFVRQGSGWVQQARLVSSDLHPNDEFGESVAIDGDTAIVGAPRGPGDVGAAYVYVRIGSEWTQQQKLESDVPTPGNFFGTTVAIDGDTAVVHARFEHDSGAVHVFTRTAGVWTREQELLPAVPPGAYGTSLSLEGDRLAVAGPRFANPGASYVYTRAAGIWSLEQRILSPNGAADDFGHHVSLSGSRLAITASGEVDGKEGAVYVYEESAGSWSLQATLLADDPWSSFYDFGYDVAMDGDRLVVGAPDLEFGPDLAGRAYVFEHESGSWDQVAILEPLPDGLHSRFGTAVDLDATRALVGDPNVDVPMVGSDVGRATAFELDPSLAPAVGYRNAGTNPISFASTRPRAGESLTFTVAPAMTGHDMALVIAYDSPVEITLGSGQTLLCLDLLGGGELVNTGFHPGPIAQIELFVPAGPALVGAQVHCQAVHAFGASPFALSNAQDLSVGPPSLACP